MEEKKREIQNAFCKNLWLEYINKIKQILTPAKSSAKNSLLEIVHIYIYHSYIYIYIYIYIHTHTHTFVCVYMIDWVIYTVYIYIFFLHKNIYMGIPEWIEVIKVWFVAGVGQEKNTSHLITARDPELESQVSIWCLLKLYFQRFRERWANHVTSLPSPKRFPWRWRV